MSMCGMPPTKIGHMTDDWLKPQITAELVARLVAAQFPNWRELLISAVSDDGWDNSTWRLGDSLSVRLPSHARYAPQVDKEQTWLPRLAPALPLPIPVPVAKGEPGDGYPLPWSVYRWLEGEPASRSTIGNSGAFGVKLGEFLIALWAIDPDGGPPAGAHNFYRGGDLSVYDDETRGAIKKHGVRIDTEGATRVWERALGCSWTRSPVWVHGDLAPGNLLVQDGELVGVIDFGCCGVGDPACDLVIAWTFLSGEGRRAFVDTVAMDEDTWGRARGWALWKALISLDKDPQASRVIDLVISSE